MCFERASGMRYRLCGCVEILEVEFVDCLLPSCRQSICHPDDCQGILCPCTIQLGPRVLLVKPPVSRRCEKCELRQSIVPLPTKAHRSRHKRDARDRHPARQPCEPIRELPYTDKPKATKTRTKDAERHKSRDSRRPLGLSNGVQDTTASPVVIQTPATAPSMRRSLLPPRPSNPHPPSSTTSRSQSSLGSRPPTSKATPIPSKFPSPPPSTPSSVFSVPYLDAPPKTASRKTSSTLSSLGSTIAKTGTTRFPLPEIPWPPTAVQTPVHTNPPSPSYFSPLDPLGPPPSIPYTFAPNSPHSSASSSTRWRTATKSTTESQPPSLPGSPVGSRSERATSRTWSWKRTGLSRPADASQPLQPLPLPATPAPPPSERRWSFMSTSTRPRVQAEPFRSQPTTPQSNSPLSSPKSSNFPSSPTPKRPKLGWTASTLMAVLPKVPSRTFRSQSSRSREASPVLVQHPVTPPPPEIPVHLQARPRRSFLRNPWK
ncbi:hypothetical protein BDV93DRAFT_55798 [Ceratobasidium sp. AG-I]|nr:hypothetical protein BDV93DRAFT_55798 [Ceratobasidium sp. AG-I]